MLSSGCCFFFGYGEENEFFLSVFMIHAYPCLRKREKTTRKSHRESDPAGAGTGERAEFWARPGSKGKNTTMVRPFLSVGS